MSLIENENIGRMIVQLQELLATELSPEAGNGPHVTTATLDVYKALVNLKSEVSRAAVYRQILEDDEQTSGH